MRFTFYSRNARSKGGTFWKTGTFDREVASPGPEPDWVAERLADEVDMPGEYIVIASGVPSRPETAFLVHVTESGYIASIR